MIKITLEKCARYAVHPCNIEMGKESCTIVGRVDRERTNRIIAVFTIKTTKKKKKKVKRLLTSIRTVHASSNTESKTSR